MILKNEGLPRLNTESGQIGWSIGLWLLLFLGLLLCTCIQTELYRATSQYMEDALAASNLAAAVIDIEEYGISHVLRVEAPEDAYNRYQMALRVNLGLDEQGNCANKDLVEGPVKTERFIVYNVNGNQVEIYEFNQHGIPKLQRGELGMVFAPGGEAVEATGIYSEIVCEVKGVLGTRFPARKGKLVEVYQIRQKEEQ
ncbi:MAG: hypothetical protein ACI4HQ_06445 [Acetatifactor sp.]